MKNHIKSRMTESVPCDIVVTGLKEDRLSPKRQAVFLRNKTDAHEKKQKGEKDMLFTIISNQMKQDGNRFWFGGDRHYEALVCEKQIMPVTGVFRVDI